MPWASHWGQDPFGLWCGFSLGDLLQRMRWIPSGKFWMGSPDEEPERFDNETRHRAILSQGYWLAETTCTQAFWREVMGKDPSQFKGDDLPVEQVSWEEVQSFCTRLNERLPGLQARLPSEAEWEYACRAGTETPFWWGDELSTDLANYDGN
jgi:formylglycine-generating enzyme required for sulfatase activity